MNKYGITKTEELIVKLNRYSFSDKALLCLMFSLDSCDYQLVPLNSNRSITPPWLVDCLITLSIISNPETKFHKDILIDGNNDKNVIFDVLYSQTPPNLELFPGDIHYILNILGNPQSYYQTNHDILLYRYSYFFKSFNSELMEITGNVKYETFVLVSRIFTAVKELNKSGADIFQFTKQLLDFFPEVIKPLSISRDELVERTKNFYDDINDLSSFYYSFKLVSSYPFVIYKEDCYIFGFHSFINAITTGFMNRISFQSDEKSKKLGKVIEKYIYKLVSDSGLTSNIEDDSIKYYINGEEFRKPDVSFEEDGVLVIIEAKKAWPRVKSTYNNKEAILKEYKKGLDACERSVKNFIRFIEGRYTLCGKCFQDFSKVFLVVCSESNNYWPLDTIINNILSNPAYEKYRDIIDNSLVATTLYNIESHLLFGGSILQELTREKKLSEKHLLIHNTKKTQDRSSELQSFVDENIYAFEELLNKIRKMFCIPGSQL